MQWLAACGAKALGTRRYRRFILAYPPSASIWHLPIGNANLAAILKNASHEVVQRYCYIDGVEHVPRQYGGGKVDRALDMVRSSASTVHDLHRARKTFEYASSLVPTPDTFSVERNNVCFYSASSKGRIDELVDLLDHPDQHVSMPTSRARAAIGGGGSAGRCAVTQRRRSCE